LEFLKKKKKHTSLAGQLAAINEQEGKVAIVILSIHLQATLLSAQVHALKLTIFWSIMNDKVRSHFLFCIFWLSLPSRYQGTEGDV
jgi:hypothetical protein